MKKPVELINKLRGGYLIPHTHVEVIRGIIDWADSIPDDAHVCAWPKGLTRERLMKLANAEVGCTADRSDALYALAAIAPDPKPKKRMVKVRVWIGEDGIPRCTKEPLLSNSSPILPEVEIDVPVVEEK